MICSCSNPDCEKSGCALAKRLERPDAQAATTWWPWTHRPPDAVEFTWTFGVPAGDAMRAEEV